VAFATQLVLFRSQIEDMVAEAIRTLCEASEDVRLGGFFNPCSHVLHTFSLSSMAASIAACHATYEDASLKEVEDDVIDKNTGICDASIPKGAVATEVAPVLQSCKSYVGNHLWCYRWSWDHVSPSRWPCRPHHGLQSLAIHPPLWTMEVCWHPTLRLSMEKRFATC
jgi:hypothetical protein